MRLANLFYRIPGRAFLLLSVVIFGSSAAVTRQLVELGENHLIDGRNPISFCNVLFVGNLCALIVFVFLYFRQWNRENLSQLSAKDWLSMSGIALLGAALAPALTFLALSLTTVSSVILIGRIGPPLTLALSVIFLNARVNSWVVFGAIVSSIGVALTVILPSGSGGEFMFALGKGEIVAAAGAIAGAIASVLSKATLDKKVALGIFSIYRTAIGTVIFFTIVNILFTPEHFMDVFSPFLWQWMFVYSGIIVVGGQLLSAVGLRRSTAAEVTLASAFGPIVGILAAYLILGEVPNQAQWIGGSVVVVGIVLNQIGIRKQRLEAEAAIAETAAKPSEPEVGYKGV